jgi:hypothetical protein
MISNDMSKPFTTEKFINDAINKFNHKFDYSKVSYVNANTLVTIVCPDHGEFKTSPWKFLNSKHGCKQCAINSMAEQQKELTKKKLEELKKVNATMYEYPDCHFTGIKDKIPVYCKKHGIFHITVDHHLRGVGCKKCADASKTCGYTETWFNFDPVRKSLPGILYIIEVYDDSERFIKIGITKNSVSNRYKNSPFKKYQYKIIHQFYDSLYQCFLREEEIKRSFKEYLYYPKRKFYPTESFTLDVLPQLLKLYEITQPFSPSSLTSI